MPTKTFPYQWLTIGITVLIMVYGWIATCAVQGEKLKQVECKTEAIQNVLVIDQKEINKENSADHKKIMESLTRIETLLSSRGYGFRK